MVDIHFDPFKFVPILCQAGNYTSAAHYSGPKDIAGEAALVPGQMSFYPDDLDKVIGTASDGNTIKTHTLAGAGDFGSISPSQTLSSTASFWLFLPKFHNSGSLLMGFDVDQLHVWELATAYDLSTAGSETIYDFSGDLTTGFFGYLGGCDAVFNSAGDRLMVMDAGGNIRTFSLTTPFDFSGGFSLIDTESTALDYTWRFLCGGGYIGQVYVAEISVAGRLDLEYTSYKITAPFDAPAVAGSPSASFIETDIYSGSGTGSGYGAPSEGGQYGAWLYTDAAVDYVCSAKLS